MSHRSHYQLWRSRCDDVHPDLSFPSPLRRRPTSAEGTEESGTCSADARRRRQQLRALEEIEFRRIRLTKRADKILPYPQRSGYREGHLDAPSASTSPLVMVPPPLSLEETIDSCLVVGQELSMTVLLLVVHREIVNESALDEKYHQNRTAASDYLQVLRAVGVEMEVTRQGLSMIAAYAALLLMVYYSGEGSRGADCGARRKKATVRLSDAVLLALFLRFLSAAIRTLTSSYSADTVYALAAVGMAVHLLACDYGYANGRVRDGGRNDDNRTMMTTTADPDPRPAFLGGTVSLNAALFSTTLLVSRIQSNAASYVFVSWVVTLFAFYPAARHRIALKHPNRLRGSPCLMISLALTLAAWLLVTEIERLVFLTMQLCILVASPAMQWWLQRYKQIISGPWDIAHVAVIEHATAATSSQDKVKKSV